MKKEHKLASVVLMALFLLSGLAIDFGVTTHDSAALSNAGGLDKRQNNPSVPPDVATFMSTTWGSPLTMDEAARIEREAMVNTYSEPDAHLFPLMTKDMNETSAVQTDDNGGGVVIESLQESGWPWQPWPSQRKDFAALPIAPVCEGRWWPKKDYSTLAFDIPMILPLQGSLYIWAWVIRDKDSNNRYLTFWFDNNFVQQFVVGSGGFKTSVYVPPEKINTGLTRHRVEISINYCGLIDQGWKLLYTWLGIGSGPNGNQQTPPSNGPGYTGYPYDLTELTPRTGQTHCVMEYSVLAGASTVLYITTQNAADPTSRTIVLYFEKDDGTYEQKGNISTGGSFQVSLGNRADDSYRKLKLEIRYLPDIDYAKRITQLAVNHLGWNLEVDYMPYSPISSLQAQMDIMIAYYRIHSYHTVTYTVSQDLPNEQPTTFAKHEQYWNSYFNHKGQNNWEYVIYVENLNPANAGWHYAPTFGGIRLADWGIAINDMYWYSPYVIMHEYGHHIYILEWTLYVPEIYCYNPCCAMSTGCGSGWYCFYHFWLRRTM
jgi:hypothetical protein